MKKLLIFLALALGALAQPSTPINNLAIQNGGTLVANSRLIYMASGRAAGSANLTFTDGTTTGQLIHPVGAVGTPSVTFLGDLDNGLYYVTTNHLGMAIGGAVNTRWVAQHTLLGGLTTDGTGVLQFPTATTSAGGITFGTDWALYRTSAGRGSFDAPGLNAVRLDLLTSGTQRGSLIADNGNNVYLVSGATTAMTIDGLQNVTWAGTGKATGWLNTTGTSANSGNGLTQRFRNGYATAGQTPAATTRTYITGSDVGPITAAQLQVGSMIHWHLDITKTAAGTASATFDICFGTAGSTSDTARLTFTKPAGVAQIDHCAVDIYATVKTNSASGVVIGDFTLLDDQTNALGGFLAAAKWVASSTVTSGAFDTTTATHVGLCVTTGASDAWTINHVQVWTQNM